MGDEQPESQSLNLQVREIVQEARELLVSCKEGSPDPAGQQGRRSPQSSRAELLAANAMGYECGVEHHSGVWSSTVSAVV